MNTRNPALRTVITALAPAVWGSTYVVTTHMLPDGHPLFAALMRALPAGVIALLVTRRLPTGSWWWKSLVLGTLNMGAFFPLLFIAAQHLPGGVAATLGAAQPIFVAGLAVWILGERLSRRRMLWGLIGMGAVAMVVLGPGAAIDVTGVVAGLDLAIRAFELLDPALAASGTRPDGTRVAPGDVLAHVSGAARALLGA